MPYLLGLFIHLLETVLTDTATLGGLMDQLLIIKLQAQLLSQDLGHTPTSGAQLTTHIDNQSFFHNHSFILAKQTWYLIDKANQAPGGRIKTTISITKQNAFLFPDQTDHFSNPKHHRSGQYDSQPIVQTQGGNTEHLSTEADNQHLPHNNQQ